MFGAVAAHKFIIAFCIGVELTTSRTRPILSYVYVCMFAVVSPLGIGIGMILVGGNTAAASGPAAVALQVRFRRQCHWKLSVACLWLRCGNALSGDFLGGYGLGWVNVKREFINIKANLHVY